MFKHTIDTSIAINASSEKVWEKLINFNAYPDWNPMIVQLDGEAKVGSKLKFVVKQVNGKLLNLAARFKVINPSRELRWAGGVPGIIRGEHYFVIESTGENSCRFRHGEKFSGLMIPLLKLFLEFKGRPLYLALNNALRGVVEEPEARRINGVHHVAISTPDIERLKNFYVDQLGFESVAELEWPKGTKMSDTIQNLENSSAKLAMLRIGNAYVELFQYSSPQPAPVNPARPVCDHGITHICLDVTGVDAEYERLKAAGMEFHSEPQWVSDDCKTVYGRDPDGNVVELQEVMTKESIIALP
jgi:catechol 2,3-dioxygenase-like lactoylglutathione lyase family enzyme